MQIHLARSFDVFDVAYLRAKGERTLLSVRIDGHPHFGLELEGLQKPSSGANVPVALDGPNNDRLIAWLDPATNKYFATENWNPAVGLLVAGMCSIALWQAIRVFASAEVASSVAVVALVGSAFVIARHLRRRASVRSALEECKQQEGNPGPQQSSNLPLRRTPDGAAEFRR